MLSDHRLLRLRAAAARGVVVVARRRVAADGGGGCDDDERGGGGGVRHGGAAGGDAHHLAAARGVGRDRHRELAAHDAQALRLGRRPERRSDGELSLSRVSSSGVMILLRRLVSSSLENERTVGNHETSVGNHETTVGDCRVPE